VARTRRGIWRQTDRDGRHWNAILNRDDSERYLNMNWNDPQNKWNDNYRFLVARKSSSSSAWRGSFFLLVLEPAAGHSPDLMQTL
jgi:hypothetical protein